MNWEYLIFNVLIGGMSTLGSLLYPKSVPIDLKRAAQAWLFVGVPFIVVDAVVTNWFWTFNPQFLTGWQVATLPIEEVLFFISVPWACLILWVNSKDYLRGTLNLSILGWMLQAVFLSTTVWAVVSGAWYTFSISIVALALSFPINWRQVPRAYAVFSVVTLLLTGIFNMYLTARPIVIYNPALMTNLRLGTIPVEDFLYGLILVLGIITLYERRTPKELNV